MNKGIAVSLTLGEWTFFPEKCVYHSKYIFIFCNSTEPLLYNCRFPVNSVYSSNDIARNVLSDTGNLNEKLINGVLGIIVGKSDSTDTGQLFLIQRAFDTESPREGDICWLMYSLHKDARQCLKNQTNNTRKRKRHNVPMPLYGAR